ncbi:LPXTG cell wall anchor domain-containing protein [Erwinia sp. CPCC 100877]|nr:LPXTG cell wall anchor domain-containing protein [Erwinia sp. CPCC 100877]
MNTSYTITPKKITGYKMKTIQGNELGVFAIEAQQVIYTYQKEKSNQELERTINSDVKITQDHASTNNNKPELTKTNHTEAATNNTKPSQTALSTQKQERLPQTSTREQAWYLVLGSSLLVFVGFMRRKRRKRY